MRRAPIPYAPVRVVTPALLGAIPVLLLPVSSELDVVRLVLAGFIGFVGYAVARSGGATRRRSIVYGVSALALATVVPTPQLTRRLTCTNVPASSRPRRECPRRRVLDNSVGCRRSPGSLWWSFIGLCR